MTEWGESLDPSNVLAEYPRPQMAREQWQNLNGLWEYAITDESSARPKEFDGQILVPFCVESALSGVGRFVPDSCALWYRTLANVPKEWKGKKVMLNFGAVDWKAEIFVNGTKAAEHSGGYTPFSVDITPYIKGAQQEITLKVIDHTDDGFQPRGKQVKNPNGIWYTSVSGIWQTVWMEPVSERHIDSYYCEANLATSTLTVNTAVSGSAAGDVISVTVSDGGKAVAQGSVAAGEPLALEIPQVKTWSPDSPFLYDLSIELLRGENSLDSVDGYAAMREIGITTDKAGHKRMTLNGNALFQFGPLDQGWWPDGLYTAPSDEALEFDILKTKEFGFNMIRKHIKVEPARWYSHCDHDGILVWQDMPCFDDNSKNVWDNRTYDHGTDIVASQETKDNYYKEWTEIINALRVFPSIVVWVPFNEAWSQFDTEKTVDFTRALDSSRLINPASGGNFTLCGDILDLHNYPHPSMYLHNSDYVNALGEYGGIGYAVEGHLWQPDKNWGYVKYDSGEVLTNTYVEYAGELAALVKKGFSAAVYTQTTDVEIEVNGLMTYDRKVVKPDVARIREANEKVIASMNE